MILRLFIIDVGKDSLPMRLVTYEDIQKHSELLEALKSSIRVFIIFSRERERSSHTGIIIRVVPARRGYRQVQRYGERVLSRRDGADGKTLSYRDNFSAAGLLFCLAAKQASEWADRMNWIEMR